LAAEETGVLKAGIEETAKPNTRKETRNKKKALDKSSEAIILYADVGI
jgi:hypothetical protein